MLAAYRARKRIEQYRHEMEGERHERWHQGVLYCLGVLDEEIERISEDRFSTQKLNPDPVTDFATQVRPKRERG